MKNKFAIVLVLAGILLAGCTDPENARRVLETQGYKNIEITGWAPFMAGKDDFYSTGFRAIGPNGSPCSGAVTGGFLFKGSTVRLD